MHGNAIVRHVVTFGRVLREVGIEVGPGRIVDAVRGLDSVDLTRQEDVYFTLRQTLVSRHDELEHMRRQQSQGEIPRPAALAHAERRVDELGRGRLAACVEKSELLRHRSVSNPRACRKATARLLYKARPSEREVWSATRSSTAAR